MTNYGFRTKLNYCVLLGYSDHNDGKNPWTGGKVTHLWCRALHGAMNNEVKETLCNLLAELAEFQLPFPGLFYKRGLLMSLRARRPLAPKDKASDGDQWPTIAELG